MHVTDGAFFEQSEFAGSRHQTSACSSGVVCELYLHEVNILKSVNDCIKNMHDDTENMHLSDMIILSYYWVCDQARSDESHRHVWSDASPSPTCKSPQIQQ